MFSFYGSMAQVKYMSLDEIIKLGIANNKQLQATRQGEVYWKEISKAPLGPPPLQSTFEYGKINSVFNDTKLSIAQPFQLPIVYKRQKELVNAELKGAQYQTAARELDLKRDIRLIYYALQDLYGRRALLQSLDTVFSKWAKAADLRYQAGESNLLESTTAKSMVEQLSFQRNGIQLEIESQEKSLGWLIGNTELKISDNVLFNSRAPIPADFLNTLPASHPLLEYSKQFVAIAEKKSATEQSGLLPEASLGFLNQSIKGWQTTDGVVQKFYGSGHRFNSVVLGVAVPIFSKAAKARWNASKVEVEKAKLELTSLEQQLHLRLDKSLKELKRLSEQLRYFETTGLGQSRLIEQHAEVSYYQGELGFLEWTQLMQQSMNLKTGYLDALKAYNDAVVEIEYLLGN
jgi:cobalt-zinc-cadmium resistance protein CzcA